MYAPLKIQNKYCLLGKVMQSNLHYQSVGGSSNVLRLTVILNHIFYISIVCYYYIITPWIQFNQNAWCYYIFISVKNNDHKCYFLGFVFFVLIWSSFLAHSTDLVAKWKAWKQLIYSILRKHNVPLQNKMICIKLKYKAKECWCNTSYSIDLYPAIT